MIKYILLPFSVIYNVITKFRNHLYNIGIKKSIKFDIPIICVGNLTVGGTGKTPHVSFITQIINQQLQKNPAILSRGYGRKSKGFFLAEEKVKSETIGDESLQLYLSFNKKIPVAVCEERILGIPALIAEHQNLDCILLDDAFQHRKVNPGFNILLSDYNRPFYNDYLLPSGRLREARSGANRADAVIVTKVPENISHNDISKIETKISQYTNAPVFFSFFEYLKPQLFHGTKKDSLKDIILVTGIANTTYLLNYTQKHFNVVKHLEYKDHNQYGESSMKEIFDTYQQNINENLVILCTEKDMVKLKEKLPNNNQIPFYYLPIIVRILKDQTKFKNLISDFVLNF